MTTDIKELVRKIRAAEWHGDDDEIASLPTEAADALEAMAKYRADYEAMKAHNNELFGKLSAAELERDRLKAALVAIEQADYYGCVSEFAAKALGDAS